MQLYTSCRYIYVGTYRISTSTRGVSSSSKIVKTIEQGLPQVFVEREVNPGIYAAVEAVQKSQNREGRS